MKSNFKEIELKSEISEYDENIDQYRTALQTESVWLFLAILGCWSVEDVYIQFAAFVITFMFFMDRVLSKTTVNKTFDKFENKIIELIDKEFLSGPPKDYYEEQLLILKNKRKSFVQPIKSAPMFFVCFGFYAWSIHDQVLRVLLG